MSISEVAVCDICRKRDGIYSCPRCGRKYCSSSCYKSKEHELCSESFFREWVETTVHEKAIDDAEKGKMVAILKKFNDDVTKDDEDEMSLVDRFAGLNIDTASEDTIWQNLSEAERKEFTELLRDEENLETIVQVIQPWWTVKKIERIVILEELETKPKTSFCPPYPMYVRNLSTITNRKPSECLQFNLVNLLYAYAFLNRFYNCELRDFLEDVVNGLYQFSPILSGERYYFSSLEEGIQDCVRLIVTSDLNIPLDFVKSIANDVCSILEGPENAPPAYYVLCALHDIKLMLFELKHAPATKENADLKKKLILSIKKIDYFMSWCLDYSNVFSELASDLVILMVSDFITERPSLKPSETMAEMVKKGPIIEEIED